MAIDDNFVPNITDGSAEPLPVPCGELDDDGAITKAAGVWKLDGTTIAATIADPPSSMDGAELVIMDVSGSAHTVTYSGSAGFNSAGTDSAVATFGGAKGDNMRLIADGGVWYVATLRNVTVADS